MQHTRIRALAAVLVSTAFLTGCPGDGVDLPTTDPDNVAPVADAGPAQAVVSQTTVRLDGSGSSDADGDSLTYSWSFETVPQGSIAELMSPTAIDPFFIPDVAGEYIVMLTVDDGFDATGTDTVSVVAVDPGTNPPDANAGPDQQVTYMQQGVTVQLDGRMSSDPDGDDLTYSWEIIEFVPSGTLAPQDPVVLIGPETETPVFDVIDVDQLGTYTIQLTVSDGVLEDSDTVVIEVEKSFPTASVLLGSGLFVGAVFGARRRQRR